MEQPPSYDLLPQPFYHYDLMSRPFSNKVNRLRKAGYTLDGVCKLLGLTREEIKQKRDQERYRSKRKKEVGKVYYEQQRAISKERRKAARRQGLCAHCCIRPVAPNRWHCPKCLKRALLSSQRYKAKQRSTHAFPTRTRSRD
jgi:hypothetical protein